MPKKFTVIVTSRDLETNSLDCVAQVEFEGRAGEDGDAFKRDLMELVEAHEPGGRRTSSKEVVVVEVEEPLFARFEENSADKRPTNGLYAQRVEVGQTFPSARAASLHLGLKNNEVAIYLSKVSHLPHAERIVKLRGVSVQYVEDQTQALLAQVRDC